jgi:hypothetical protein
LSGALAVAWAGLWLDVSISMMYLIALTRYRSGNRRQPLPGQGTTPLTACLCARRGDIGSATNFEASTPASVEPAEGPLCRPPLIG